MMVDNRVRFVTVLGRLKIINKKSMKTITQSSPSWDYLPSSYDWRISGNQIHLKKKTFVKDWNLFPHNIDNINITDKVARECKSYNCGRDHFQFILLFYTFKLPTKMKRPRNKFRYSLLGQYWVETDDFLKRVTSSIPGSSPNPFSVQ